MVMYQVTPSKRAGDEYFDRIIFKTTRCRCWELCSYRRRETITRGTTRNVFYYNPAQPLDKNAPIVIIDDDDDDDDDKNKNHHRLENTTENKRARNHDHLEKIAEYKRPRHLQELVEEEIKECTKKMASEISSQVILHLDGKYGKLIAAFQAEDSCSANV